MGREREEGTGNVLKEGSPSRGRQDNRALVSSADQEGVLA